eukprot:878536_1
MPSVPSTTTLRHTSNDQTHSTHINPPTISTRGMAQPPQDIASVSAKSYHNISVNNASAAHNKVNPLSAGVSGTNAMHPIVSNNNKVNAKDNNTKTKALGRSSQRNNKERSPAPAPPQTQQPSQPTVTPTRAKHQMQSHLVWARHPFRFLHLKMKMEPRPHAQRHWPLDQVVIVPLIWIILMPWRIR